MIKVFIMSLCFLLALSTKCLAIGEIDRLQDFYKTFKDIEGSFTQKTFIKEINKSMSYKGSFYIKGNNIFLDYKGKKPQKVYINQSEIIIYQPTEKTAFKSAFDESRYGQTPLALIKGLTDIKKDFKSSKVADGVIILKPIKTMGNITEIKLTLSDMNNFPISKMLITDNRDGYIEITFVDVKVNHGFKDSLLMFNPPSDVTIVNQ